MKIQIVPVIIASTLGSPFFPFVYVQCPETDVFPPVYVGSTSLQTVFCQVIIISLIRTNAA